ncbi:hypothetical protein G9X64_16430 [Rhizobium sophorae]|uniref:Uncharacterized protein n=3 Tax=Rhizobium TaxID=379 RepID=A0A7Z0RI59_9HYPH|nr:MULTISPECIES: hypothetical protein [Rhizobium]MBX4863435.1 hypothetical protein [Rhizobium bangladeshense]NKK74607.1 hypothetical protein [Rhizobium leguminosarum bv. viciae]MBA5802775.1 hypothetical protein [Rhizobium changzhiense]MCH4545949.1 hypothetical protein [Rhizobium changzhiense]MCV9942104.1 hypothetical protein [Rhizobium sp. BT-175]
MGNPKKDAAGQFAKSQADRKSTGVASAKPTVITGSEDATVNKNPPGKKAGKDWDINYDPADMNEGRMR